MILRNDVGWFDQEENNSNLVAARLSTDAADVKSAIAERISVILQNMTSLLVSFVVGFIIEWRVALLILVTFPLLVLANFAQVIKHTGTLCTRVYFNCLFSHGDPEFITSCRIPLSSQLVIAFTSSSPTLSPAQLRSGSR